MRAAFLLIAILAIKAICYTITQTDWSGGPGVLGPNHYWYDTFLTENNIEWSGMPGRLCLEAVSIRHTICSGGFSLEPFIYLADINGDGAIDVVTSTGIGKKHIWLENDGTGSGWVQHLVYSSSLNCDGAYPADIDGDNDLDIVGSVHGSSVDSIFWFENLDGLGINWGVHYLDSMEKAYHLAGMDMDGDLDVDIIAGSDYQYARILWWENEDGTGTSWQSHEVIDNPDWRHFNEIFPVDLDLDGDLDVLGAFSQTGGLVFCENEDGIGTSWSYYVFDTDAYDETPYSVHAGDMDGDGDLDVVAVDNAGPFLGRVFWFENLDGSCENWELHILEDSLPGVNAVRAGDITGNGFLDIVVGSGEDWGVREISFWENIDGTAQCFTRRSLHFDEDCYDVQIADIDLDGINDIVARSHGPVFWLESESVSSGFLVSSIRDMWGYPEWETISWEGLTQAGTDMYFQVRGSNVPEDMGNWSGSIYDPGSLAGYMDSTYRYIQYKVVMETEGRFGTPVLDLVGFEYDNLGIEEGESGIPVFSVSSNPCYQNPTISFFLADPGIAEVSVYDLSGREVFRVSDEWSAGANSVDVTVPASGTYFARLRSDSGRYSVRFVVLSI